MLNVLMHFPHIAETLALNGHIPGIVRVTIHHNIGIWQIHRLPVGLNDTARHGSAAACAVEIFQVL